PQHGSAEPRAAISSFGFGGTNYHAVLEAYSRQNTVVDTSRPSSYEPEPIAIVGMAGMFPDASDVQTFWANLLEGKDAVTHFPRERFDMELYYDPSGKDPKKTYTTKGGFLTPVKHKPTHWKIPPSSASYVDEAHYLALRTAEQALAQAGYDPDSWNRGNISVMLGFLPYQNKKLFADVRVNYQEIHLMIEQVFCEHASIVPADARQHILEEARNRFFEKLPEVTEDTLQGYLGSLTAGRITKHFDFHGAQLATDAACCSAHLAFLVAVQSLRHKKSDAVLVGGVNADMSPEFYVGGCGIQALSADAIRPFDAHADGFVPGEGAGFFVLRRLSDAERDGQPILAVIRSVAATSDGKSGSILAPSLEGEATAMINALQQAGISPDEVDYVECHGTGTAMGDATEVEALSIAYGKERRKPLRIGSVKSNIGHLLAAAAVPALMKTICAIREHIIPASINLEVLIPTVVEMNGTIKVVTATEAWVTKNGQPRRAGVSGFGLGGANSHIIVEEYIPIPMQQKPPIVVTDRSIHPLPIATVLGASLGDCTEQLLSLAHELVTASENRYLSRLADIQLAISSAKKEGHRVAIVAANAPELLRKAKLLQSAIRKGLAPDFLRQQGIFAAKVEEPLQVAVVFPGQGVQYPNMLRDIMAHFPEVAAFMNKVDEEYRKLCGKTLTSTFLTDAPDRFSQSDEDIHCAVFAVNCALFTLLRSYGLEFDAVIGQSAGELAALVATNTLALPDALRIVRERTLSVLALKQEDPGKMLTVYCSAESARHFLNRVNGYCEISADNSPGMCIISGETQAILALRSLFEQSGIQSEVLPVSHGYHSQMIADARTSYRQTLDTCTFAPPAARVISTITGNELHNMPVQHFPKLLESQFVEPVRLRQAIETAYEQGVRLFIECGPKRAVSTYISETLSEKDVCVQATMHPKVGELEQLYRALACLFVHGKGQLTPQNQHEKKVGIEMNSNNKEQTTTQTADQATLLFLQSMRDMIDAFLQSQLGARTSEPVIQAAAVRPEATKPAVEMKVEIAEVPQPVQNQVQQQVQKPVQRDPGEVRDEVTEVLLSLMVQRTGYPKDMLELDLDLEADLGIDTVKQVAILADARHHFGLEQEEGFRVRDYHTLHKIITYFTARLTGAQSSPTPVAAFFR
ncbi:MAG: beta-ketoacyl synthase N-terminal-like domain-containing protein, partial [Clostridia bacterium]